MSFVWWNFNVIIRCTITQLCYPRCALHLRFWFCDPCVLKNSTFQTRRCLKKCVLYLKTRKSPQIIIQVSCLLPQTHIFRTDIVSRKAYSRTDNADMLLIGACLDEYQRHHAIGPGPQQHIVSHISWSIVGPNFPVCQQSAPGAGKPCVGEDAAQNWKLT